MNRVLAISSEGNEEITKDLSRVFDVYRRSDRRAASDFLDNCSAAAVLILDFKGRAESVISELRNHTDAPIIAVCSEKDAEKLYKAGADDVFYGENAVLLTLKVSANVKRYLGMGKSASSYITSGNTAVSLIGYKCEVDGKEVRFTKKELEVLYYLLKNRDTTVSRNQILDEIWGLDYVGDGRTVDVHIAHIRKKLVDCGSDVRIVSFAKIGYRAE